LGITLDWSSLSKITSSSSAIALRVWARTAQLTCSEARQPHCFMLLLNNAVPQCSYDQIRLTVEWNDAHSLRLPKTPSYRPPLLSLWYIDPHNLKKPSTPVVISQSWKSQISAP